MAPRSGSVRLQEVMPEVSLDSPFQAPPPEQPVTFDGNVMQIDHGDGSVTIDFSPDKPKSTGEQNENEHFANLADDLSEEELSRISNDLMEGVASDITSRADWIQTRARGIELLGVKLKNPRANVGSGAVGEGMSSIDHPLILEATINFQATARAELLPAQGPVKVRNDSGSPPPQTSETSAQRQLQASLAQSDELASALERDLNHYLTVTATEYIPDTDRMLFMVGFGGDGFKKVYNCPLRRRPVSESVDAEDLIVSNAATDLNNCGRVTHQIKMRKAVLKRMQIVGAYREVELAPPQAVISNLIDQQKEAVAGQKEIQQRPEDRDYTLYEIYTELDLDEFAPEQFKGKGLPLPYRVTIETESRKILDIRRNWDEDDEECCAKKFFVQFPFVRGLGFYGLGYIHLLGNTTITLTAAWREIIDAGMFSSFPGFIYNKSISRQLTNEFRVPPGGGIGLDLGPQGKVQDNVMAIPYREPGAGFVGFVKEVEQGGRRIGATANVAVGEGKQDAPVGTTLALIEQATKVMDSAHKRLHAAQAEEFALLKERFKEDPEAFWRFNKSPSMPWEREQFVAALNNCNLVPVADPNNPTSLHRVAKAALLKELQKANPSIYDAYAVDMRILNITGIDPQGLFRAEQAPPPPDPRFEAIKEKAKASQAQAELQLHEQQLRHQTTAMQLAGRAEDRQSRERIEMIKLQIENGKVAQSAVIHDKTAYADAVARAAELRTEQVIRQQEQARKVTEMVMKARIDREREAMKAEMIAARERQQQEHQDERHMSRLAQREERHQQSILQREEMAKIKKQKKSAKADAEPKPKKGD